MNLLLDPMFWALISMLGMVGSNTIADRSEVGAFKYYGIAVIALVLAPRFIIPLPFIEQQRFEISNQLIVGFIPIIAAVFLWLPLYKIVWATSPDEKEHLVTSGVYGIVRHPGYLGDILFILGWSVLFGSVAGIMLTPLWVVAFYLHSLIEENSLVAEHGQLYSSYKLRVRSRVLPGVPF